MKKRIIAVLGAVVCMSICLCLALVSHRASKITKETGGLVEEERKELSMEGDPGLNDEDLEYSLNEIRPVSRETLIEYLLENNGRVPYLKGGRYHGGGFQEGGDGFSGEISDEDVGLDSLGYVYWIYERLFGIEIGNLVEMYASGNIVSLEDLLPGDIGMVSNVADGGNLFGIFVGYDQKNPVFSYMSSLPAPKFPEGRNRLCTISGQSDEIYDGCPPIGFQYFVRPAQTWENSESETYDLTGRMKSFHTGDERSRSRAQRFAMDMMNIIFNKDFLRIENYLAVDEMEKWGYIYHQKELFSGLEDLRIVLQDKDCSLYNMQFFEDASGAYIRLYFADRTIQDTGELGYDKLHGQWMDWSVFFLKDGSWTFLPFHRMNEQMWKKYGFTKG